MLGRIFGWHAGDMARALEPAPAEARASLENPSTPLTLSSIEIGAMAAAGVSVTEETAMRFGAVYTCVKVIAETVASLPLHVFRRNSESKGKDRADEHPLYWILHDEANPSLTSFCWRETFMSHDLLWGDSFSLIEMTQGGKVLGIYPLPPWRVEAKRDPETRRVFYDYHLERGGVERLPAEEVLHIPALGWDGLRGKSPIRLMREAVGLGVAAEQFGARFIGNDMRPGIVVEHPLKLSDKAKTNIEASFQAQHGGLANKNKIKVLEEGMKLHEVGIPPEDAQFLETRKFQRSEIYAIYRVPPHMAGDLDKATFSNIEHQDIGFAKHCIRPWLVRIEQELNRKLFRSSRYFAEFDMEGLLRGDYATRTDGHAKLVNAGIMMPNEARSIENLPPAAGGDVLRFPVNVSSEDERKAQAKQKAEPAPADPKQESPDDDEDAEPADGGAPARDRAGARTA